MKKILLLAVLVLGTSALFAQNILFQVNMSTVTDPYTTPEVNGNFNNWCGGCAPMSDTNGDDIWELSITLAPGTYEYKFAYDTWAGQETLVPGSPCTITTGNFTNRTLTVTQDATLPVVCWGSCDDCGINNGPYNVTFQVDMSTVTALFTTPEVNGTFNNWCGGCAPMSDANNDKIWEITIPLAADTFEYKFAYDSWAGSENLTEGSPCTTTANGFTNRKLIVTENTNLGVVCWATCAACLTGINEIQSKDLFSVNPNPATDNITITLNNINLLHAMMRMVNSIGQVISSEPITNSSNNNVNVSALADGLYFIQVYSESGTFSQPVIIKK